MAAKEPRFYAPPMAVARESILAALRDLEALEEITLCNLQELSAQCELAANHRFRDRVLALLQRLRENEDEHRALLRRTEERLRRGDEG